MSRVEFDFVCPECRGPLEPATRGKLRCPAEGHVYSRRDGVLSLLTDERFEHYNRFLEEYMRVGTRWFACIIKPCPRAVRQDVRSAAGHALRRRQCRGPQAPLPHLRGEGEQIDPVRREAQRIKLAQQLAKPSNGHTLYILDEPTTGLHLADVQRLIDVLQKLVDQGNTVAVIEHNMEIIREADYIIDLGPEGGAEGGRVVSSGSPKELLNATAKSHTARYFKKYLNGK